jgi:hemerythrin superfamily protein
MNVLKLLEIDHRTVERLFDQFEGMGKKARGKSQIAQLIVKELSVHTAAEEQVFYPFVRRAIREASDVILEALEEHHVVKWLIAEINELDVEAERFDAKMKVLMDTVQHHIDEEEEEIFPLVRKHLKAKQLEELGALVERAKRLAPTRPQPRAPDTPPGNLRAPQQLALNRVARATKAAAPARPTRKSAPAKKKGTGARASSRLR